MPPARLDFVRSVHPRYCLVRSRGFSSGRQFDLRQFELVIAEGYREQPRRLQSHEAPTRLGSGARTKPNTINTTAGRPASLPTQADRLTRWLSAAMIVRPAISSRGRFT